MLPGKQCLNCVWFFIDDYREKGKPTCMAFPAGIPDEVWMGYTLHDKVMPGQDGGKKYEPILTDGRLAWNL